MLALVRQKSRKKPAYRKHIYPRLAAYFLFYCILAVGLTIGIRYGYHTLRTHPAFAVAQLRVENASPQVAEELHQQLAWINGRNFFSLEMDQIQSRVQAHAWVARASVQGLLPDTIKVDVLERRPAGLIRKGRQILIVGEDYKPIAAYDSFTMPLDFPVITGLNKKENLEAAIFKGLSTLETIKQTSLLFWDYMETLDLSDEENMIVQLHSVDAPVYLGAEVIPANLINYLTIAEHIEQDYPNLNYIELGFPNQIAIMPKGDPK